jgi:hypothetical protein
MKSIAKQKFEQYLQEREAALQSDLNVKFKATPIPATSLVPKFKELISNHGTRSTAMREKAIREYIQRLETDKDRKIQITKRSTVLHDIMKEIEEKSMPLPQKMHLDIERRHNKSEQALKTAGLTNEHTFHPKITQNMPNFRRLHQAFYAELEKKKAGFSPTVIQPFKGLLANEKKKKGKAVDATQSFSKPVKPVRIPKEIESPKVIHWLIRLFQKQPTQSN